MEVIDFVQVCIHEGEELAVGIDEDNAELLGLLVNLQSLDVCGHVRGAQRSQGNLTTVVQFETVLGVRLCFLLRILQGALHLGDAGDDLQHLEMERVKLLASFHGCLSLCHISNNGCHTCHRLSKLVTGELDFLALASQFVNNGLLASPDALELVDAITPYGNNDDEDDDIDGEHPPGQPPRTVDDDFQGTLLIADSTIGTDCFHVQNIFATAKIMELHAMQQGITISPVVVEPFHPVHELETFALIVVTGSKLNGEGALAVVQLNLIALVE